MGEREHVEEQIKLLEWTLTLREAPHLRADLGRARQGKLMSGVIRLQIEAKLMELRFRLRDLK